MYAYSYSIESKDGNFSVAMYEECKYDFVTRRIDVNDVAQLVDT